MSVRVRQTCRTECLYMYCLRYTLLCYVVELAVGSEQKLYLCYGSSDPVGPSMIPIKTLVIEQVRPDIPSVKMAYVKLACNRVISPGISHIACESVETAIRTFMFGCLFSIFHHAIKNVILIENTDQIFSM